MHFEDDASNCNGTNGKMIQIILKCGGFLVSRQERRFGCLKKGNMFFMETRVSVK